MSAKTLIELYSLRLSTRKKNENSINQFDGQNDFLDVFKSFCQDLLENQFVIESNTDNSGNEIPSKKMAAFPNNTNFLDDNRSASGTFFFSLSGESFDVVDMETGEKVFLVNGKKHGASRGFFFYIKIPTNHKYAYIVLQRKGLHGIKGEFQKCLRQWLELNGYAFSPILQTVMNEEILKKMVDTKPLKKINFIRRMMPMSPDSLYNETDYQPISGQVALTFKGQADFGLGAPYRDKLREYMYGVTPSKTILLGDRNGNGIEHNFDEIQFSLEIAGKPKSFYVYRETKMRASRDISEDVITDIQGNPTFESLKTAAKTFITDFTTYV